MNAGLAHAFWGDSACTRYTHSLLAVPTLCSLSTLTCCSARCTRPSCSCANPARHTSGQESLIEAWQLRYRSTQACTVKRKKTGNRKLRSIDKTAVMMQLPRLRGFNPNNIFSHEFCSAYMCSVSIVVCMPVCMYPYCPCRTVVCGALDACKITALYHNKLSFESLCTAVAAFGFLA